MTGTVQVEVGASAAPEGVLTRSPPSLLRLDGLHLLLEDAHAGAEQAEEVRVRTRPGAGLHEDTPGVGVDGGLLVGAGRG